MPLLVLAVTGSPAKAGVVGVARSLAYPLTPFPAGALLKRLTPRAVMIACAVGRAMAVGSLGLVASLGRPSYLQMQIVAFVSPLLWSVSQTAKRDLMAAVVLEDQQRNAATLQRTREWTAAVGAPFLAGTLFQIGESLPFLADTVEFLTAALAVLAVHVPPDAQPPPPGPPRALRRALAWQWRRPLLRVSLLAYAAANVPLSAVALLVVLIARAHGDSATSIGVAFAIIGAGGVASSALARVLPHRAAGRKLILSAPCCAAVVLPVVLVCHAAPLIGVVAAVMFLPMAMASSNALGEGLSAHAPEHLREPIINSAQMAAGSISWLGPLATGALFQHYGETTAVLALTAWSLAVATVATATLGTAPPRHRRPITPDRPALPTPQSSERLRPAHAVASPDVPGIRGAYPVLALGATAMSRSPAQRTGSSRVKPRQEPDHSTRRRQMNRIAHAIG